MEPDKKLIGIVIRADGTVPFDDEVSHEHRSQTITHLIDSGNEIKTIPNSRHIRIKNWKKVS